MSIYLLIWVISLVNLSDILFSRPFISNLKSLSGRPFFSIIISFSTTSGIESFNSFTWSCNWVLLSRILALSSSLKLLSTSSILSVKILSISLLVTSNLESILLIRSSFKETSIFFTSSLKNSFVLLSSLEILSLNVSISLSFFKLFLLALSE